MRNKALLRTFTIFSGLSLLLSGCNLFSYASNEYVTASGTTYTDSELTTYRFEANKTCYWTYGNSFINMSCTYKYTITNGVDVKSSQCKIDGVIHSFKGTFGKDDKGRYFESEGGTKYYAR